MTTILKCENIKKEYGDQTILSNIHFEIYEGDRIGLLGNNGAGKSTLAKIIFGTIHSDHGQVLFNDSNLTIGYLHQSGEYETNPTCDYDTAIYKEIYESASHLKLERLKSEDTMTPEKLSGGEKTKLALAKIWSQFPNLLILDEPTNHMDTQGIKWLIEQIQYYYGTLIVISHDRYFLDAIATRIIEIEDGLSYEYEGNYTSFKKEKQFRYETQLKAFENQEDYKRKVNEEIARLKTWSEKAHRDSVKKARGDGSKMGAKEYFRMKAKKKDRQIKSKIKKLKKIDLEGVSKPKDNRRLHIEVGTVEKRGKRILEAHDIGMRFENQWLFSASNFYIKRGDRIGVFGPNGCGKSTLIKAILGHVELTQGHFNMSPSIKISYTSQDLFEGQMDSDLFTLFDVHSKENQVKFKNMLYNIGFDDLSLTKSIGTYSYGEQTKLKMLDWLTGDYDLLILDEPTNHLDLQSREKLEEALELYQGTVIIISHDRYLLDRICDQMLFFEDAEIFRYDGKLTEYFEV